MSRRSRPRSSSTGPRTTSRDAYYAGYFSGNVFITGGLSHNFTRSAVAFPDGTQRALYGMESPELWFEDFGAAKLVRGHALVKLDVDFVKVIKRGEYKVFLTPEGDCRGLYVRRRAASFQVRELMGGKSRPQAQDAPEAPALAGRRL